MTRILCNSWPKAGTHVILELSRLILGDSSWYNDQDIKYPSGENEFIAKVEKRLAHYAGLSFAIKGHFGRSERIADFLKHNHFRHLLAVRDPREIICSTYRWLKDLRPQWEISRFLAPMSPDEQIENIITGLPVLPPFGLDHAIYWDRPLAQRYAELTAWIDSPDVCVLAYEELTGALDVTQQYQAIERALNFIGVAYTAANISTIASRICNPKAATFHTGPASDWTKIFNKNHRRIFVETGGETLVERLGYAPTLTPL